MFENMLGSLNSKNHLDTENFFSEQKYDRFRGNLFQYRDARYDSNSILGQFRTPEKLKFCKWFVQFQLSRLKSNGRNQDQNLLVLFYLLDSSKFCEP